MDAKYASGYGELGAVQARRGNWLDAEKLFLQALALNFDNPEVLHTHGIMLAVVGRLKEALEARENLLRLEPSSQSTAQPVP